MIDLKLSLKRLKLHLHYYTWRYVVILLAALFAANLLYTTTAPKTPYGQKVEIYLYSGVLSDDATQAWQREILRVLPPDQKEVNILSLPVIEGQEYTFHQVAAARMAAGEGTIWILPRSAPGSGGKSIDLFTGQAASGAFIPLEELRDQLDLPRDIDLSDGTVDIQPDLNTPAVSLWCGIPLDDFKGLYGLFNPEGLVMALPVYAKENLPNALAAMNWLLSKTEAPAADDQTEDRFTVTIASNYFASADTSAWEMEQQGKFYPEMGFELIRYHTGREDMVAQDIAAGRVGKPGLCVVPEGVFVALARAGELAPLDDVQFLLQPPAGADLAKGRETANVKEGEAPAQERLYGIPVDRCRGLTQVFNPTGMFLVFPNQDGEMLSAAIDVANWLMGKTSSQ